ncbi:BQ2448_1491 [Microbotryum intermedium]|uniref:BQ2448_1491 protein n=1 Tax=Microbotryum intermedium TaxID=269621 RepID=A0A238FA95_9BASI|nr:BQ2448_1491 [Microbotryum intermedium]
MSTSSDDHSPNPGNDSQVPKSGKDEAILLVRCLLTQSPTLDRRSNWRRKREAIMPTNVLRPQARTQRSYATIGLSQKQ